jgi:hypothetical protein
MGSADVQGHLWGRAPQDWAEIQEVLHAPLWEAIWMRLTLVRGPRFWIRGVEEAVQANLPMDEEL